MSNIQQLFAEGEVIISWNIHRDEVEVNINNLLTESEAVRENIQPRSKLGSRRRAIKIAYCPWAIQENPASSSANQIARFIKTNACHIIIPEQLF
jgi:hypothetical protein